MALRDWPARKLRRIQSVWIVLGVIAGVLWWLNAFGARTTEAGLVEVRVGAADLFGWIAIILLPPLLLWAAWRMAARGRPGS